MGSHTFGAGWGLFASTKSRFKARTRENDPEDGARALAATARQTRDVLMRALAQIDPGTHAHTCEVTYLARATARALGLDRATREAVAQAAELHDIGKVAIPGTVLLKAGHLDPDERALMRRHTLIGEDILLAAPALTASAHRRTRGSRVQAGRDRGGAGGSRARTRAGAGRRRAASRRTAPPHPATTRR